METRQYFCYKDSLKTRFKFLKVFGTMFLLIFFYLESCATLILFLKENLQQCIYKQCKIEYLFIVRSNKRTIVLNIKNIYYRERKHIIEITASYCKEFAHHKIGANRCGSDKNFHQD